MDKEEKDSVSKEGKDMSVMLEKEKNKFGLNVDYKKFKSKVPHLPFVNGITRIDPEDPLHKKWFEEFKK